MKAGPHAPFSMSRLTLYTLSILVLIVVLLGGLYWVVTKPLQQSRPPVTIPAHFAVFLQHKPCLRNCPVYAVLAKGSGTMEYVGQKNVNKTGNHKAQVNHAQLVALYRAVHKASFFSIPDVYHNGVGGSGCKSLARGKPAVVIGVTRKAETKVIHYYYGCSGAPAALGQLADQIDRILNTRRWVGET